MIFDWTKPDIWFIKMLRNQLGECSHYLNYFVYKIKNADFFSPQFLSARLQACMPLTNMEKEKSIIVYKGQW